MATDISLVYGTIMAIKFGSDWLRSSGSLIMVCGEIAQIRHMVKLAALDSAVADLRLLLKNRSPFRSVGFGALRVAQ